MSDTGTGGADRQPAPDLRSQLAQAVADAETAAEPVQTREAPEATPVAEKPERPSEGRARGADGKFVAKEGGEVDEDPDETPDAPAIEPAEHEEPAPKVEEPAVSVPQHWSQADKDLIAGLPKEHQGKVIERYKAMEAGFTPKLQRLAQMEREFAPVMEMFAPHVEGLRQRGQAPSDVIRAWGAVESDLISGAQLARSGQPNTKGAQIVAKLIQSYQVDPGAVAQILMGQQPAGQPGSVTPLPPEFQQLSSELQGLKQREQQRVTAETNARQAAAQQRIDVFAQEKDATGGLKHPFYSELESDMMALARIDLSQGKTPDIADLYERAAYANPETRSKLLAAQEAEVRRKAAAERKAKAVAAQRAASSVAGSPGSGQSPTEQRSGNRDLRATIEAAFADQEA